MIHYIKYEVLLVMGAILFIGGLFNAIGIININSDYFWALAGLTLIIEGLLEMRQNAKLKRLLNRKRFLDEK